MIQRNDYLKQIKDSLAHNPVSALLGPRQCGKTTLAQVLGKNRQCEYFDLENPVDLSRLEAPMTGLQDLKGLVIIDEIQRKPELFEVLRVLSDRADAKTKYLILGSASPHLVKGASESLAGRIGFVDLSGFNLTEAKGDGFRKLWYRGGLPRSYLAKTEAQSFKWRNDYIRTFLERDIPGLGITIGAETLRRFWIMVAHYHGQIWNAAEFARSLGRAEATARNYLDILTGAYMVRQLQPWHENLKKRQVKSPKVFIRDSGVLHALFGLQTEGSLLQYPKLGASWEGFAIEQLITVAKTRDFYFWKAHSGAELDLLIHKNGKRYGFEIKYADAPKISRSMRTALEDLNLDSLQILYPGDKSFPMDDKIEALSILDIHGLFKR